MVGVAEIEQRAAGDVRRGGAAGTDRAAPPGLPPLPGVSEHHHLGVHVPPPHLLPQTLRRRRESLRPRDLAQPVDLLLRVEHGGVGAGVLQARLQSRLKHKPGHFMVT